MTMTPARIYAASLVLGIVLAYGASVLSPKRTSVWTGLVSDGIELVLVMTPANCGIDGAEIRRLNEAVAISEIPIRGVFLTQVQADDREKVRDMFGFEMPISFDIEAKWANAIVTTGLPTQVAIVARRGRVEHVAPVEEWESLLGRIGAIPTT